MMMTKHQQLSQCGSTLCATIPQKIVETFDISTKRFFEWKKQQHEIIGTLCKSETVVTTRIQVGKNNRFLAEILPTYVTQYTLMPTKKGGPKANFDWNDTGVHIRIQIGK